VGAFSVAALALLLGAAGVATWVAGVALARTTGIIDRHFQLGDALGGMIFLAIAGSLPELAITVSAAASGNLGLAAGNLIGGVAVQTMVIVVCDAVVSREQSLTFLVGSLLPVLQALLVVVAVSGVLMGMLLPESVHIGPMSPASILIAIAWASGVFVLNRARRSAAWVTEAPGSDPGRPHRRIEHSDEPSIPGIRSTERAIALFAAASLVTLGAGILLEVTGNELANRAGINGVVFGATILAAITAVPEVSAGITAVRLGDHQLAVGDIFGSNAFMVCLFLLADLIAGKPVLPSVGTQNGWLAALGVALTVVFAFGVIVRRERCYLRLGLDSLIALAIFGLGVAGLFAVSHG